MSRVDERYLLLKQISEGLHSLYEDFRNENQLKSPPISHRDFESQFFF